MSEDFKFCTHPANRVNALNRVNPEQAKVLEMQAEHADAFDTGAGTYDDMRKAYIEERKMWNKGGPEIKFSKDIDVPFNSGTVKTRLLKPEDKAGYPVLFYIHGGGYVLGNNDTHGLVQRKLCSYADCAVIGIEYTLSPEAVYPQGIEECVAVVRYFIEHANEYGIDATRLAFGGDSGGANMSMGCCMMLRDQGFDMSLIKANALFYGVYGLSAGISSYLHGGSWDGMAESDLAFYWSMYLGGKDAHDCPYFNIYLNDLTHDVPPAFIACAELDPLRDDSYLLSEILSNNGIENELVEYKGVLHAFVIYSNYMRDAEDALVRGAEFVKKHF